MMGRRSLALLFCVFLTTAAHAAGPATITLSPASPRPGDTVTATIRATWSDSCVPTAVTVEITGRTIRIQAAVVGCERACLAALTDYTVTATFTAPAPTGAYDIEYFTVECGGLRRLAGTLDFTIASEACAFGQSLRAQRSSIRVDDVIDLTWCNPSVLIPDATFVVEFYRIYYAHSASGPFTRAIDLQGQNTTSVQLRAETEDIGKLYVYVEAHGCTTTITGQCAPTVELTNIVAIDVSAATGCAPDATTLCLDGGRFMVRARWRTSDANGDGQPVRLTDESGYFWFFGEGNVELTVKVLDACTGPAPRFWVFAAGMTNVQVDLTVTDTKTNTVKTYANALNAPFSPILDTNAFATCP